MTEIQKDQACSINEINTGVCGPTNINGITIDCEWNNYSNMCDYKENGSDSQLLQKACYRHPTDCNLKNPSTCTDITDITRISGKLPDIDGKVNEFEDCNEMLNNYEEIIRKSDYQTKEEAREKMNKLLSQCVNDDDYICTDNEGNIFPDPENYEEIDRFLNALSDDNNTNRSKIQSIMMKKINKANNSVSDKEDLPDDTSTTSKKISKKDLLLIIGGASLGLVIVILIILLIIKSRSAKK